MTLPITKRWTFVWRTERRTQHGHLTNQRNAPVHERIVGVWYNDGRLMADVYGGLTLRIARDNGSNHYTTLRTHWQSPKLKMDFCPALYWRKTRYNKDLEQLLNRAIERDLAGTPSPLPFETVMRRAQGIHT